VTEFDRSVISFNYVATPHLHCVGSKHRATLVLTGKFTCSYLDHDGSPVQLSSTEQIR